MLKPSELSFQSVVTLLEACAKSKPTKKRELLRSFNKQSILPYRTGQGCDGLELYEVYRLLLPGVGQISSQVNGAPVRKFVACER